MLREGWRHHRATSYEAGRGAAAGCLKALGEAED
jgi:hypothetical protein